MRIVDQLLREYIAEHESGGEADPRDYLRRLEGADRRELQARIDRYLEDAPEPPWDEAAFRRFVEDPRTHATLQQLDDALTDLDELRTRAGLQKGDLAARLAGSLRLIGSERHIARRYHQLETGQIDAERVKAPVWQALADVFGATAEAVRRAAGQVERPGGPAMTFARSMRSAPAAAPPPAAMASPVDDPDESAEVDDLFLGG
jgi:hypothetical protein